MVISTSQLQACQHEDVNLTLYFEKAKQKGTDNFS